MDKTLIRQSALKYWKEFLATPAAAAMARNWQEFLRERMQGNQGAYFGFYALPSEFDVMSDLRMLGATVHLPRVLSKTEITFYRYLEQGEPVTALVKGSFGIQEPGPDARPVDPTPADTLIVPSVSANAEGYRLGRGGGYYDRLAEKEGFRQMYKCALIPEKLLDAAFKEESHDLRLNKIVTEERIVSYP
ncbi:MAG: 5-formyltetrahydrofolate cyclo-ligase [Leptospiraceae bacterium]|nr:5-formyltetrahydrofolate cyclo-ligase [Leptospiraceae bacterium]